MQNEETCLYYGSSVYFKYLHLLDTLITLLQRKKKSDLPVEAKRILLATSSSFEGIFYVRVQVH